MYRSPLSKSRPSSVEIWYVITFSCLILLIGNGKLLLERMGLISSADLIGQQVSTKVLLGTNWLDNFRFTANIINLIVWGATGLVIYSVLQAIVRGLRTMQFQRDFDSQLYVHPQNYTRQAYWRQIVLDSILGFILLALLVLSIIAYAFIVIPDSFVYIQRFIYQPTLHYALDPLKGLAFTIVGTSVVFVFLKLVIRHHHISMLEQ